MLYFIFRNTQRHPIDLEEHLVIKNQVIKTKKKKRKEGIFFFLFQLHLDALSAKSDLPNIQIQVLKVWPRTFWFQTCKPRRFKTRHVPYQTTSDLLSWLMGTDLNGIIILKVENHRPGATRTQLSALGRGCKLPI